MKSSFYSRSIEAIFREFNVDPSFGLSPQEIVRKLNQFGPNEIQPHMRRNPLWILGDQLISPMILLLLVIIGISLVIGHTIDAAIVAAIVGLNAGIGFAQEMKAEKAMESIRALAVPEARVLRNGKHEKIPSRKLVPGDIIYLEAGDRIPADIRLFETHGMVVDESLLTGESISVSKITHTLNETGLAPGDQCNIGFMGTHIVSGRGSGICFATGFSTELGRISKLVSTEKSETPLKQRMDRLTKHLVLAAFFFCFVIFVIGAFYHESVVEVLLTAISLAISAIPEGLPAVITISLSLGAFTLARRGVLVRKLQAVEALGSINTICADKTGTLTINRMEVRAVYLDGKEYSVSELQNNSFSAHPVFFQALALCNDAQLESENLKEKGDPMEIALLKFALLRGWDSKKLREEMKRIGEIPFDTERKRMTTIHTSQNKRITLMKGAPETVLPLCVRGTGTQNIHEIFKIQEKMASEGLRVLAVAMRDISLLKNEEPPEEEMIFLGFVGLQDPPRMEARSAIADCRQAGIRPIMITGDHPITAAAIGRELGIFRTGDDIVTGKDMAQNESEELRDRMVRASVFARVSPEDKFRIVQLLKDHGQCVAMTGDGVNDAPALKKADIGIAMGRGTDVAKEASSLILMEENFSTIVCAIREGRIIYDNIRKFVRYMLTTNLGEIATMFFAMIFIFPLPLIPVQILWINLVTDGLPAIALGFEPAEKNVMAKPPRELNENILGRGLWQHAIWVGLLMGFITVGLVFFLIKKGEAIDLIRTMAFTTLVLAQMGHVLAIRSETRSLWKIGFFSNYRLLVAVLLTIIAQLGLLYLKPLQIIFHTTPLTGYQILLCLILASLVFVAVETEKWILNNHDHHHRHLAGKTR
ncbi:MAG: hypothetical protein A3H42_05815 [Deltaproteobacteria bacterium RIFCSPLOWO2_02_FULL_46_8]|nr:MAG: hypothetical protein A3H42_05815 [Deltaproteobacteria bacterium RIFCSPLOWO2_02_FULL_46_8]